MSRELRRNSHPDGRYSAFAAQERAGEWLKDFVKEKLGEYHGK